MYKVNNHEQSLVAVTSLPANVTQSPATSTVAQLNALQNVPQQPVFSWSRIVAGAECNAVAASFTPDAPAEPPAMNEPASEASLLLPPPPGILGQDLTEICNAELAMSGSTEATFHAPAWQRATRSWRAQQRRSAAGENTGAHGNTTVEWRVALPTAPPAQRADDSDRHYQILFARWEGIQLCAQKMNLHQLTSEMGKLNRILGRHRKTESDNVTDKTHAGIQCAQQSDASVAFCANVAEVMVIMGAKAQRNEAPDITLSAIFTGLRALAKAGFARQNAETSAILNNAYHVALDLLDTCPAGKLSARMIAICLNGIKEGVAHQILAHDNQRVRETAGRLIAQAASPHFRQPQAQNIANVLNGLKSMLDNSVLRADDAQLRKAAGTLLALICTPVFAPADALEIANALNGLKAVLDHRLLAPDHQQVKLTASQLLGMIVTPVFSAAVMLPPQESATILAQPVANALNGLKAVLDHHVLPPADKQVRLAAMQLLEMTASAGFGLADAQNIANGFSGVKAILDYHVLPPDSETIRDVLEQLLAMVVSARFHAAIPQNIANALNGLKAVIDHHVLQSDNQQLRSAAAQLLALAMSASFAQADALEIANTFNGLKSILDYGLLTSADKQIKPLACQLLAQVTSPRFAPCGAQPIANAMNGTKALLEHKVLPPEDPRLRQAAAHLLRMIHLPVFETANAQAIVNVMNGLRTLLDSDVLQPGDTLVQATAQQLLKLMTLPLFNQAIAQHISNACMGLKVILLYRVLPPGNPWVRQGASELLRLMGAENFARADAQRIANGYTGIRVILERQVLPADSLQVKQAADQLLKLTTAPAFLQSLEHNPAIRQQGKNQRKNQRDGIVTLNIANVLSGLKAILDYRVVPPGDALLRNAVSHLLAIAASPLFSDADGRNIAHLHNGLKAALEHQVLPAQSKQLQETASTLLAQTASYDFTGEDMQTVANTFNGLRAMLDFGVLSSNNPVLHQAVVRLLAQVNAPGFGESDGQGVTNMLNGIKAVLEHGILRASDKRVRGATSQLLALTRDMEFRHGEFVQEGTQTIANAFNGLKAVLDYQILPSDSVLVREVAERLLQLAAPGNFSGASAQGTANSLNGLRALLEYKVLSPANHFLRQAARHLLEQVLLPGFAVPVAQNITNVLNVVLTLTEQGVVPPEATMLKRIIARLLHLAIAGALDQAFSLNMHYFFRSTIQLHQKFPQLVSNELLHEKGQQLLQRITASLQQAGSTEKMTGMLVQLQQMMSTGWVDISTSWALCEQLRQRLPEQGNSAGQSAALLNANCRLYCELRSRPDIELKPLLEQIIRHASALSWEAFQDRKLAVELYRVCVEIDDLRDALRRGKKGSVKTRSLEKLKTVLQTHAVPILRQAVQQRQRPGFFDVSNKEMLLFQRYLAPDQWLLPIFTPWGDEYGRGVILDAYQRLAGAPRALVSDGGLHIAKVDIRGLPLKDAGVPRERVLATSVYNLLFNRHGQNDPILVEIDGFNEPPLFIRHGPRWYRTELVRGSVNKHQAGKSSWLWGIPAEMGSFLTRHMFTCMEGRVYGQRMLFPEATGDEHQPAPVSPTLVGEFEIACVPEARSRQDFVPESGWDIFCARDGCGFIHEDLARQLLGEQRFAKIKSAASEPARAEGSLPAQALQHYVASDQECEQIAAEFHQHARREMGSPLALHSNIPSVATLVRAARIAGPEAYHLTAVPAAGEQLLFADTPGLRRIAAQDVLMTRAPHDAPNVLRIMPEHIGFTGLLNETFVIQYSMTGFTEPETPDTLPVLRSYKGQLLVVPERGWPATCKSQIVLPSEDLKLCSRFNSLETRHQLQHPAVTEQLKLRGCIVLKQLATKLIAVPEHAPMQRRAARSSQDGDLPAMKRLAADYDGDDVKIASGSDVPTLAALVAQQNHTSRGNPKLPKTFTLACDGELDIEKLQQLHSNLLQDASVMMERLLNLPAEIRDQLMTQLIPGQILAEFYRSDDWLSKAGLQQREGEFHRLNEAERAQRIIRCELELLCKAGTDQEKTRIDFSLLWQRLQEFRKVLGPYMAQAVPWGKGIADKLELALTRHPADDAEYLQAAKEVLSRALDDASKFTGLPASITRKNLSYLLGRD